MVLRKWFRLLETVKIFREDIIQIASFFWLITWMWLISRTFLLITWCFSRSDFKFQKWQVGIPPGPRGGAEAGERREAPNGGRSGAPRARRCTPVWFLNFTTHRENKVKILSKKVRDTQANARYSAKNNVAIRMIATFMPTYLSLFTGGIYVISFTIIKCKYNIILAPLLRHTETF